MHQYDCGVCLWDADFRLCDADVRLVSLPRICRSSHRLRHWHLHTCTALIGCSGYSLTRSIYKSILTTNILLAAVISIFIYVRSFNVEPGNSALRELAQGGQIGNIVYDFWIGRELNPRLTIPLIGEVGIKGWLKTRPGLTGWVLLNLAFVAHQFRNYGYLSDSILFTSAVSCMASTTRAESCL